MITGIECAGLVLAVLPLFIETAKSYKRGIDTMLDLASQTRRDEKLEEFYEDFWWELFLLDRQIREIVEALPCLSDNRKTELTTADHLDEWTVDADVACALEDYFKSETDFNAFMVIMTKIVQLLAQVIKDTSVQISEADKDQSKMYHKLKRFEAERKAYQTSRSVKERLRFWKKEKDRSICLKALRTWNKRLLCLVEDARKEPAITTKPMIKDKRPYHHLRPLSRALYNALANSWKCSCDIPHEARFCLILRDNPNMDPDRVEGDFDFLFSAATNRQTSSNWQEGTILVRPKGDAVKYDAAVINKLCDAIHRDVHNHCLHFLVENAEKDPTVWQLRPQPKRYRFLETAPAVSLQSLLTEKAHLPLIVKRRLALTLAKSLLQFHEGLWRGRKWSKEQINFLHESADHLDYQRPYVTTRFDKSTSDSKVPDLSFHHRNISILALGILLIEIHTGNSIECYRSPQDEVNVNTDWMVADHVVKSLDDCSLGYRGAIQACLDTPWVAAGQKVDLEDSIVINGVYKDIVQPLEDELQYLFREKF